VNKTVCRHRFNLLLFNLLLIPPTEKELAQPPQADGTELCFTLNYHFSTLNFLTTTLLTSIELWPSFVIFSYVKKAAKEEYPKKAHDSRRKAQTDCQVNTESNNGRANKSPETPLLPAEKSYGTRQIEQNKHDQDWKCPIGHIRNAAFDCGRSK